MAQHCEIPLGGSRVVCDCALFSISQKGQDEPSEISQTSDEDIIDRAITVFRVNVLFRNFDVKGPGDRLLIYLILYISACLQRLSVGIREQEARNTLSSFAHEHFKLPGDAGFPLNNILTPPKDEAEAELLKAYLTRCREEVGTRLIRHCYREGKPSKFWMAYAHRRFMNLAL